MRIIKGNILDIENGVICHQVNCLYVAGAGLAKQIKEAYPNWYLYYTNTVATLGDISLYTPTQSLTIVNMYSQNKYGTEKRETNYSAFGSCLVKIWQEVKGNEIYFPYGIGCGLGGGDWNIISQLIEDVFPNAYIVQLGN